MLNAILPPEAFAGPDTVATARALLGKILVSYTDGIRTAGRVVETEAYLVNDAACHAHLARRTARTEPMFGPGGTAYVYLCYGIHHLFNIATNAPGTPEAVLVRAIEPMEGLDTMAARRGIPADNPRLTAGPGALTQALGVGARHNAVILPQEDLWFEDDGTRVPEDDIAAGTRVGVAYAGADALLPYRFWVRGNRWVSRAKGLPMLDETSKEKAPRSVRRASKKIE